jgi:ankyrin repeat protein
MARKKTSKKQEMRLVPHRSPDLSSLLAQAQTGDSAQAVSTFLHAGGSPAALIDQPGADLPRLSLMHSMALRNAHPHKQLAESVRLLVAAGADIDTYSTSRTGTARTALMHASERRCCSKPLQLLLQHGADPCQKSPSDGVTALHTAAAHGLLDSCRLLVDSADSAVHVQDDVGRTPLSHAGQLGQLPVLELLRQRGASVQTANVPGDTPLHYAAATGQLHVMRHLLLHGAELYAANNKHGLRPLHSAACTGNVNAVEFLLAAGADADMPDNRGMSAIFLAIALGYVPVMEVLVSHGVDLRSTDQFGNTLIKQAADCGQIAAAQWLIERGLSANAGNIAGGSPLHGAANAGYAGMVELLLAHGADVHSCDLAGVTALDQAALNGHTQCVQLLISAGADVTRTDVLGTSSLHRAVYRQHADVVRLLIEHGAAAVINNSTPPDCDCCGSLCALMISKEPAMTKLLLAAGAAVHAANDKGCTCLHVAAAHGYPAPVVCLLIKAGADLHAVNNEGKTAAAVARGSGNDMLAALLNRAARD